MPAQAYMRVFAHTRAAYLCEELVGNRGEAENVGTQKSHNDFIARNGDHAAKLYAQEDQETKMTEAMDTIDLTAFDRWWANNHGHAFLEREIVADLARLFKGEWTAVSRGLQPFPSPGSDIEHFRIGPDGS